MEQVSWLQPVQTKIFATTRWSIVQACLQTDEARSKEALAEICQTYWRPVYVCIRQHGHSSHDAQDLTQDFFLQLLGGRYFEHLNREKGRFRAYLSVALQNFLHDRWRRRWTWRRGRGVVFVPLDINDEQSILPQLLKTNATPEFAYERQWARSLIDTVLNQLRIELLAERKEAFLDHFDAVLSGDTRSFPYDAVAQALKQSVGTVQVSLHRCRHRFQVLLREEIARTVVSKSEIEEEIQHLFRVFTEVP